ncbi:MAG: D-alanyl-D-alanine carboxypeptidase [Gammaproteobacteria bacterium]|nr:D-alanyl-D-alanine carboxypeptidase [Gammaproteobacteria bacterium]
MQTNQSRTGFFTLVFFLFSCATNANTIPVPAPPALGAKAYILQDFHSGKVIVEHNADDRIEPASITKIMTAYVVFDEIQSGRLSLHDKATISVKAWRNPGVQGWTQSSRMFAEVNSKVAVSDLLRGLIIQSGNDAAIALAEHIAGSEQAFVQLMNDAATRLELKNTHYLNVTGWPMEGHYTSAHDIASLSRALIREFPEYYQLYSEKRFTYNNISQANRNAMLWKDESVDGIKTGHTEAAGYCLAASAERNGMRLISVVMGAPGSDARVKYSQSLLNYGFRFYETHHLFDGGVSLKEVRVWKGDENYLNLGVLEDLYITIPRGQYNFLKSILNIRKVIDAPVKKGDEVGQIEILLNDQPVREEPLVALNSIERGNFFQQLADQIVYLFR